MTDQNISASEVDVETVVSQLTSQKADSYQLDGIQKSRVLINKHKKHIRDILPGLEYCLSTRSSVIVQRNALELLDEVASEKPVAVVPATRAVKNLLIHSSHDTVQKLAIHVLLRTNYENKAVMNDVVEGVINCLVSDEYDNELLKQYLTVLTDNPNIRSKYIGKHIDAVGDIATEEWVSETNRAAVLSIIGSEISNDKMLLKEFCDRYQSLTHNDDADVIMNLLAIAVDLSGFGCDVPSEYIDMAVESLTAPHQQHRYNAVCLLKSVGKHDPSMVESHTDKIEILLDDDDEAVVTQACLTLGEIDATSKMNVVRAVAEDDARNDAIRQTAREVVDKLS